MNCIQDSDLLPESGADASVDCLRPSTTTGTRCSPSSASHSCRSTWLAPLPVPDFFFDLAPLLKDGYYVGVLTTSIDTLLEQALDFSSISNTAMTISSPDFNQRQQKYP